MLPQWVLEILRPIVRIFSRLLWRVRWTNADYIPQSGGVIIASNHQTYLDPFWLSCPLKRPFVISRGMRLSPGQSLVMACGSWARGHCN
jgi:1-acyl-sn-glycerol-3-phosphate acyltransferase